jgi:recombination protein RecT
METTLTKPIENKMTAKSLFNQDEVKQKFQELLGKRSTSFITSVLQIVASNDLLAKADPVSIYHSAAVAATLDLPLNNAIGFAYIVPYNQKQKDGSYKTVAQFQLGYKGFKQLALRSGQFLNINASDVREGELKKHDRLTGEMLFDWIADTNERLKKPVIGYVSFFRLMNGYSQTLYMTIEELDSHGKQYSQTYKRGYGLWKDNFDSMCLKTVTKLNLSKNAPLSVEMQKAVVVDQAVINDTEAQDVTYADNDQPVIDKAKERIRILIEEADKPEQLESIFEHVEADQVELFDSRMAELKTAKK